jgi:hypothetical protein
MGRRRVKCRHGKGKKFFALVSVEMLEPTTDARSYNLAADKQHQREFHRNKRLYKADCGIRLVVLGSWESAFLLALASNLERGGAEWFSGVSPQAA